MSAYDPFLLSMGWNDFFQSSFDQVKEPGLYPARIISQGRGHYHIQVAADHTFEAEITTKLHNAAKASGDFPAVGDWVTFTPGEGRKKASIHHVLERKTSLQRKRVGAAHKSQHLATNVEFLLIVTSLNEDFDLDRLGRYLELGKQSGATSVFVLTKTDLCAKPQDYVDQLEKEFGDVEVLLTSATDESSMAALQKFFQPGITSVLLGSSGVGKSTLTNYMMGTEAQKTGTLGLESKGRHTTTSRNMLVTRWGGLVIDTPGMQEILVAGESEAPKDRFQDIDELVLQCKFTNCRHQNDPGCAVTAALKNETLSAERWGAYQKLISKAAPAKKKWQK